MCNAEETMTKHPGRNKALKRFHQDSSLYEWIHMGSERGFPLLGSLQVALKAIPWWGKST